MKAEERWVSVQTVAAHLGVANDSVYRWIDEGGLPAHRVGRLLRFKLSEIDRWVRQNSKRRNSSNPSRKMTDPTIHGNQSGTKKRGEKKAGVAAPLKSKGE